MSLRTRTLQLVVLTFIGLIIVLYLVSRYILLNAFAQQEIVETKGDMQRVMSVLNESITRLDGTAMDWAYWDDTYTFMQDHNTNYAQANLETDTAWESNHINVVLLLDASGKVVYSRGYDYLNKKRTPVPASLQAGVPAGSPLLNNTGKLQGKTGLLALKEGVLLLATEPILTSHQTGPSMGTLLFGRYLDRNELADLSKTALYDLSAATIADPATSPDFRTAERDLLSGAPNQVPDQIVVQALDSSTVAGYTLMTDLYGHPAVILKASMPRTIYPQGELTAVYTLVALTIVALIFGCLTSLLLEKFVFSRLKRLSASVAAIGEQRDISVRVEMPGRDELARVAADINEMLAALEKTQEEQRESEDRYRAVVEQADEAIFLFDSNTGRILEANNSTLRLLGYTAEEIVQISIYSIVAHEYSNVQQNVERILSDRRAPIGERQYKRKDGSLINVEVAATLITHAGKEVICVVGRDVTERKKAEKVLLRQNQELEALHDTTLDMIERLEMDDLLQAIVVRACKLIGTEHGYLYVVSPGNDDEMLIKAGTGIFTGLIGFRTGRGEGIGGMVLENGQPICIHNYADWEHRLQTLDYLAIRSIVGIPLRLSSKVSGVIGLARMENARDISGEEIQLLERFAQLASIAVENANLFTAAQQEIGERKRMESVLQELAIRDEITGLYNRREMGRILSDTVKGAERHGTSLALIMLDIDHFKHVNDAFGHPTGDGVLRWLAQILKDNVRAADRLARYGGEEFAIILPETSTADALAMAEQLRKAIADVPFISVRSNGDLLDIPITVSLGVAVIPSNAVDERSLIVAADRALYAAKRAGRNTVIAYTDTLLSGVLST